MGIKIYLNGKLVNKEEAKISIFDHGLLYGDGVFEGIRSYNGLVFKLKEHIDRLYESAHTLMLTIPLRKEEMIQAVIETLKANRLHNAYIRVVVTRGEGDLGLDPRKCKKPNIFIIADKIVLYPERYYREGLTIITVPTQRNIPEALNPQIKSLNYLNNILAKIEAINCGVEEAIMLNSFGYVAECTGDNIFMVKNNVLITPPPYVGILKGITRTTVIELAEKEGIEVKETIITRHDLYNADECFLTGTAAEIIPVVKIDSRVIGEGKPGKITLRLMREFKKLTKTAGVRYRI
ncbi:MAG: branched-chain-amino-acid transaminase [Candidatus Omnitrophica bacterium]|nr:branched-chain-amino-acid transaminase [Candidatus Omnitrophota bacterium]MCM8793579.1 branched-chain-amino-acid transaminase [Candidatus Omnitrophota bacterium]